MCHNYNEYGECVWGGDYGGGVSSMGGRVSGLAANVVNALHGMHTGRQANIHIHPVVDEREGSS